MKNPLIHCIYLSVITVICILFFLKIKSYDKALLKSKEEVEGDFITFERQSKIILEELEYRVNQRPRYGQYYEIAKNTIKIAAKLDTTVQVLAQKTTVTNSEFRDLRKQMNEVRAIFLALIPMLHKEKLSYLIPLDTAKNGYSFDSKAAISLELNAIRNEISKSKLAVMNYCLYHTTHREVIECGPNFRLAFYPRKGVLIEGERMEAEVTVVEYSKQYKAFNIEVNHKPYAIKEGVVVFKDNILRNVGEHKIETSAMIKDVFTNDTIQIRGEYLYSVLPKCSRDCLKNQ